MNNGGFNIKIESGGSVMNTFGTVVIAGKTTDWRAWMDGGEWKISLQNAGYLSLVHTEALTAAKKAITTKLRKRQATSEAAG